LLTKKQIEELAEAIRLHSTWLIRRILGEHTISESDLKKLKDLKLLSMDVTVESIKQSYVLGKLESTLKEGQYRNFTWEQLQLKAKNYLPTPMEQYQIDAAENTLTTKFRGLGDDIKNNLFARLNKETEQFVTEAQVQGKIKDIVKQGVELQKDYLKVAKDLVEELKEPNRNWFRVAATELHAAHSKGYVDTVAQKQDAYEDSEGVDSDIAIVPNPGACEECLSRYIDQETGNPKIFPMKELLANAGSNYVKPWRVNALACVPPLHPNCSCRPRFCPPGWGFDEKGKFTVVDMDKYTDSLKKLEEGEENA
jgi:hypothetical protein